MTLPDDFADYPKSITELRSDKSNSGSAWTPRDALIDALRRLDAGEIKPTALVIAWQERTEEGVSTTSSTAAPDNHVALGVMHRAADQISESMGRAG